MIHTYFLATEAFVILGYLLGSVFFPKRYPLIFYKFLGITVFSLLLWYLALVTGKGWTSLVPIVFGILGIATVAASLLFKSRIRLPAKKELLVFFGIEILSYAVYLFFVYLRTFKPDILGTEKLMDVALINAIMKQNHIPIENPWLSGFFMNYYYFGHFILGVFQYMLQIPTAVGYNLAISLFGIWILQAGYLVARALRLTDLVAFFMSFIMTFGGNLYLLVQMLTQTKGTQWFASATRVIPYTINEFPGYSVILGDLHGHYLSYPFFLVGVFLLLDIFFPIAEKEPDDWVLPKSVVLGVLLGHLYLTNSWDIFTLVAEGGIMVALLTWYMRAKKGNSWKNILDWYRKLALWVGIPVALFSLPQFLSSRSYYLPPVGGIGFNTSYSNPWDMFMLFGQFIIITLCAIVLLAILFKKVGKSVYEKVLFSPQIALPMIFLVIGATLILTVELIYAKDVFTVLNQPYARTNTVFKIYFHAWSFLALGSGALFISSFKEVFAKIQPRQILFSLYAVFFCVVSVILSYPFISIDQYIVPTFEKVNTARINDPRWSNGYAYMKEGHGEDYELVSYLLTKPHATILEIVTYDSYSYFARISSYTGMSAVSGWPLHNVQWYNGYDGKGILTKDRELVPMKVADRVADIEKLYTTTNEQEVRDLLDEYEVDFAVFGEQERDWAEDKKKTLNQTVYDNICKIAWEQDGTTLYDCKD